MPLISQSIAARELQGHLEGLRSIIKGGWDDYMGYENKFRVAHCSVTRASIVHDHQVDRASQYAEISNGVQLIDIAKMKILYIGEKYAVRFKKLSSDKRSSNQPTQQVIDFRQQEQMAGLPETYNFEAGYILNSLETEIESIHLVCPNGPGIYWDIELIEHGIEERVQDIFDHQEITEESNGVVITGKAKSKDNIIPIGGKKDGD